MSEAFTELMFWIVVFVVFFFGFKKLQQRKKDKSKAETDDTGENG